MPTEKKDNKGDKKGEDQEWSHASAFFWEGYLIIFCAVDIFVHVQKNIVPDSLSGGCPGTE